MARAPQPAGFSDVPYDHIPMVQVDSSQIACIGYSAARKVLAVQFKHGAQAIYQYPGVSAETHAAMMAADSVGTFFGQHIKALPFEKYPASVLEELPPATGTTPGTIAAELHGREYGLGYEIPDEVAAKAKGAGILIVSGESDDRVEFHGAWRDEASAWKGAKLLIYGTGVLPSWEQVQDEGDEEKSAEYHIRKRDAREIEAVWCPKGEDGEIFASWAYKTDIPHATFDIMEDGKIYCRGIVFALADIAKPVA